MWQEEESNVVEQTEQEGATNHSSDQEDHDQDSESKPLDLAKSEGPAAPDYLIPFHTVGHL